MKIIGYNSSHDTCIAQFDSDSWEVDFLYYEDRFRRAKHFSPDYDHNHSHAVERMKLKDSPPDHFIGASFDRRVYDWGFENLSQENRKLQREILAFCKEEQLTYERIQVIKEKYKEHFMEWGENIKNNPTYNYDGVDYSYTESPIDDSLHATVAKQLGLTEYHYEVEHHLYHAECGYYFSDYRKGDEFNDPESAICIVQDGGGAVRLCEDYPNYQEVESIYLCSPDSKPELQWQRLSNYRSIDSMGSRDFPNELKSALAYTPELTIEHDGAEIVISSAPSSGMNFSAASMYFGFDKLGRAAGKVMGAAAIHYYNQDAYSPDISTHAVCNLVEQKAYDYTCTLIQKGIDLNPDCKNILLSGGYALNCTNNAKYLTAFPDYQFFVDPVANDAGTAIGSAIRLARAINVGEEI